MKTPNQTTPWSSVHAMLVVNIDSKTPARRSNGARSISIAINAEPPRDLQAGAGGDFVIELILRDFDDNEAGDEDHEPVNQQRPDDRHHRNCNRKTRRTANVSRFRCVISSYSMPNCARLQASGRFVRRASSSGQTRICRLARGADDLYREYGPRPRLDSQLAGMAIFKL